MHKTKQSPFCATVKQKNEHVLKIKDFIWNRLSRLFPRLSNIYCKWINIHTKWSLQSNWAWWGFKVRDFRWRFGIRSTPKLLFRFLFFMRLGLSISFPCALRSFGERAWWSISQHRFRADGLQTNTMPRTSRVHPAHIVEGVDLQSGMMQRACHFICVPPFWP